MHTKNVLRVLITALACVTVVASAVSAAPQYRTERVYAQCSGTTKVSNVNSIALGEATPTWSTQAPTQSTSSGAGCGHADAIVLVDTQPATNGGAGDLSWRGTYTGNLNNIVVEAHMLTQAAYSGSVKVQVFVDGVQRTPTGGARLDNVRPTLSSTGASQSIRFGISGLGVVDDPNGVGGGTHTIAIGITGVFTINDAVIPWVWGNSDVPAGLTFNGDVAGLPTIQAQP